ncbi:MAG: response regulator transcription factor [Myxococcota bacterium]
MGRRILVVEDDTHLGEQIQKHLRDADLLTVRCAGGDEALEIDPNKFDLILLDLMIPGTYGLDVLKHYRQHSDTPILILSARNETSDRVRGLALGADDYQGKPFWPEELVARVKALLRRPRMTRGDEIVSGAIRIDAIERTAYVEGVALELTVVEWRILFELVRREGQALTREMLADKALDPDRKALLRSLDVHMSRLRKKLNSEGSRIETVWGIGYRFRSGADD